MHKEIKQSDVTKEIEQMMESGKVEFSKTHDHDNFDLTGVESSKEIPAKEKSTHLGDGAYATLDEYRIIMTANHHDPESPYCTDVVYLEFSAIRNLLYFLKYHGIEFK